MGYTAEQKGRIDAATQRLETAKSAYAGNVNRYNEWVASVQPCYQDPIESASAASTWYNPTVKCKPRITGCHPENCKSTIDLLNGNVIPALRAAYQELNGAQSNYDKVLQEISNEVVNDPTFIADLKDKEEETKVRRQKYIFWTIATVVIGGLIFSWFKLGRNAVSA